MADTIDDLPYQLVYDQDGHSFQVTVGGGGMGGVVTSGVVRSDWARYLMGRVYAAALKHRRAKSLTAREGISHRDVAECDAGIRRDAGEVLDLVRRAALGAKETNAVFVNQVLNFR